MASTCSHLDTLPDDLSALAPSDDGCHECLEIGARWVHLRMCQQCGHVGCCDSSPNKHATAHHHESGHPIIRSFEPGEEWFWCFDDRLSFYLDVPEGPHHS
jgi:hypothetical protein